MAALAADEVLLHYAGCLGYSGLLLRYACTLSACLPSAAYPAVPACNSSCPSPRPHLQVLLLWGADRDLPDADGRTPIWLAAAAGESECVEVLLSGAVNKHAADAQVQSLHC